jgi:hypothetical protein
MPFSFDLTEGYCQYQQTKSDADILYVGVTSSTWQTPVLKGSPFIITIAVISVSAVAILYV